MPASSILRIFHCLANLERRPQRHRATRRGDANSPQTYYFLSYETKTRQHPHKLGANQKEPAVKATKRDANFKQSRDLREDRGERQMKTGSAPRTMHGK